MEVYINEKLNIIEKEMQNAKEIPYNEICKKLKEEIKEETLIKEIIRAYKTNNGFIVKFKSSFYDDLCEGEVYMSDNCNLIIWNIATIL